METPALDERNPARKGESIKVCVFGASGYVGASIYQILKEKTDTDVVKPGHVKRFI
ncbi:hypothetical protein ACFQ4A_07965 [Lentibacillus salinarum]|uniref:Semialdehyde dehydrogenase NAD-binding domain-containing protein n=1 Tax=Lentibacillus salinarum TaxID=446820 RepID=A0ABW3ZT70_9BACI